jgi:hypothetical protein
MTDTTAPHFTLTPEEQCTRRSEVRSTIVPKISAVTTLTDGLRLDFSLSEGLRT